VIDPGHSQDVGTITNLPAGTYLVWGDAEVKSGGLGSVRVGCQLLNGTQVLNPSPGYAEADETPSTETFGGLSPLAIVGAAGVASGGTLHLRCTNDENSDDGADVYGTVTALRVDQLN
jgi:hypothetical protein